MATPLRWYEGAPATIPSLACWIEVGDFYLFSQVSRIDKEGAFIAVQPSSKKFFFHLLSINHLNLVLTFQNLKVQCVGCPVVFMERAFSIGIRFDRLNPDVQKKLGDFIQILEGVGYV